MNKKMLVPLSVEGTQGSIPLHLGYEWIKQLPNKNIYFSLFERWPSSSQFKKHDLPNGYDYYVVSFHLEAVDVEWLKQQQVNGTIIVLSEGNHYQLQIPGVHFVPFYYWHHQLAQMQQWFGVKEKNKPRYKFSAVCNRITQSKIWITTKLLETASAESLIVLNSQFLEEQNVHGWQDTGNLVLDQLTQTFRNRYLGQSIKIDDFDTRNNNYQTFTANPWQPLYQDCVINFTNESFHYSLMQDYIWPGPFITEKTLKCLLGGTAFVPVGQFETYRTLTELGLTFDYGFDTAWDSDPGNFTRAQGIVSLIDELNQLSIEELVKKTQGVNQYNQNHIVSGEFFKQCEQRNAESIEQIHHLIS